MSLIQLGKYQYTIGKGKQMLTLFHHRLPVFLFFSRLTGQFAAIQNMSSHQDGTQRRLHVVYHSISKILLELLQMPLCTQNFHLAENTVQHHQKHHPKRQKQIPYGTYDVAIRILHHTLYTKDAVLLQRYKPGRNILIFCRGISCFHHCTIGGSVVLADTTLIGHSQGFQPGSKSRIEVLHGERKFHSAFIDAALHNQSRA